jgi:hypothetical protein
MDKPMKSVTIRIRKLTVKRSILFGISAAVLLAVAVAVWQHFAWQSYTSRNDALYAEARSDAMRQLRDADQPESVQTLAKDILQKSSRELCQAPALTGLRIKVIRQTEEYQRDCQRQKDKLIEAANYAKQLSDRLATEQHVADILKTATDSLKKSEEGNYAVQQKIWQQTKTDLSKLDARDSYSEVLKSQLVAIDTIIKSYDGLIAANQEEKRNQFDDAAVELREAYGALGTASEKSTASYQFTAGKLYDTVSTL